MERSDICEIQALLWLILASQVSTVFMVIFGGMGVVNLICAMAYAIKEIKEESNA